MNRVSGGDFYPSELESFAGRTFLHSVVTSQTYCLSNTYRRKGEWNLDGAYRSLDTALGISNNARSSLKVQLTISADGTPLYERQFAFGEVDDVSLNVSGRLRLLVEAVYFTPRDCSEYDRFVLGDATLTR